MTDFSPDAAPTLPPLWQSIVRAIAQKGLAALATWLTVNGVIATDQQSQLVSLGLSVVLWSASFIWTAWHERSAHAKLAQAIAAPAAKP